MLANWIETFIKSHCDGPALKDGLTDIPLDGAAWHSLLADVAAWGKVRNAADPWQHTAAQLQEMASELLAAGYRAASWYIQTIADIREEEGKNE